MKNRHQGSAASTVFGSTGSGGSAGNFAARAVQNTFVAPNRTETVGLLEKHSRHRHYAGHLSSFLPFPLPFPLSSPSLSPLSPLSPPSLPPLSLLSPSSLPLSPPLSPFHPFTLSACPFPFLLSPFSFSFSFSKLDDTEEQHHHRRVCTGPVLRSSSHPQFTNVCTFKNPESHHEARSWQAPGQTEPWQTGAFLDIF